jgi:hypothetical protein
MAASHDSRMEMVFSFLCVALKPVAPGRRFGLHHVPEFEHERRADLRILGDDLFVDTDGFLKLSLVYSFGEGCGDFRQHLRIGIQVLPRLQLNLRNRGFRCFGAIASVLLNRNRGWRCNGFSVSISFRSSCPSSCGRKTGRS